MYNVWSNGMAIIAVTRWLRQICIQFLSLYQKVCIESIVKWYEIATTFNLTNSTISCEFNWPRTTFPGRSLWPQQQKPSPDEQVSDETLPEKGTNAITPISHQTLISYSYESTRRRRRPTVEVGHHHKVLGSHRNNGAKFSRKVVGLIFSIHKFDKAHSMIVCVCLSHLARARVGQQRDATKCWRFWWRAYGCWCLFYHISLEINNVCVGLWINVCINNIQTFATYHMLLVPKR